MLEPQREKAHRFGSLRHLIDAIISIVIAGVVFLPSVAVAIEAKLDFDTDHSYLIVNVSGLPGDVEKGAWVTIHSESGPPWVLWRGQEQGPIDEKISNGRLTFKLEISRRASERFVFKKITVSGKRTQPPGEWTVDSDGANIRPDEYQLGLGLDKVSSPSWTGRQWETEQRGKIRVGVLPNANFEPDAKAKLVPYPPGSPLGEVDASVKLDGRELVVDFGLERASDRDLAGKYYLKVEDAKKKWHDAGPIEVFVARRTEPEKGELSKEKTKDRTLRVRLPQAVGGERPTVTATPKKGPARVLRVDELLVDQGDRRSILIPYEPSKNENYAADLVIEFADRDGRKRECLVKNIEIAKEGAGIPTWAKILGSLLIIALAGYLAVRYLVPRLKGSPRPGRESEPRGQGRIKKEQRGSKPATKLPGQQDDRRGRNRGKHPAPVPVLQNTVTETPTTKEDPKPTPQSGAGRETVGGRISEGFEFGGETAAREGSEAARVAPASNPPPTSSVGIGERKVIGKPILEPEYAVDQTVRISVKRGLVEVVSEWWRVGGRDRKTLAADAYKFGLNADFYEHRMGGANAGAPSETVLVFERSPARGPWFCAWDPEEDAFLAIPADRGMFAGSTDIASLDRTFDGIRAGTTIWTIEAIESPCKLRRMDGPENRYAVVERGRVRTGEAGGSKSVAPPRATEPERDRAGESDQIRRLGLAVRETQDHYKELLTRLSTVEERERLLSAGNAKAAQETSVTLENRINAVRERIEALDASLRTTQGEYLCNLDLVRNEVLARLEAVVEQVESIQSQLARADRPSGDDRPATVARESVERAEERMPAPLRQEPGPVSGGSSIAPAGEEPTVDTAPRPVHRDVSTKPAESAPTSGDASGDSREDDVKMPEVERERSEGPPVGEAVGNSGANEIRVAETPGAESDENRQIRELWEEVQPALRRSGGDGFLQGPDYVRAVERLSNLVREKVDPETWEVATVHLEVDKQKTPPGFIATPCTSRSREAGHALCARDPWKRLPIRSWSRRITSGGEP